MFPQISDDTVKQSEIAIRKYENNARIRARKRSDLALETGYIELCPGMF